jgi:hypothetical protein
MKQPEQQLINAINTFIPGFEYTCELDLMEMLEVIAVQYFIATSISKKEMAAFVVCQDYMRQYPDYKLVR